MDADHEANYKAFNWGRLVGDVIMTASFLKIQSMVQLRRLHLLADAVVRVS